MYSYKREVLAGMEALVTAGISLGTAFDERLGLGTRDQGSDDFGERVSIIDTVERYSRLEGVDSRECQVGERGIFVASQRSVVGIIAFRSFCSIRALIEDLENLWV